MVVYRFFLVNSSLALAAILFNRAKQMCKFDRGHYEKHFYEISLNLDYRSGSEGDVV